MVFVLCVAAVFFGGKLFTKATTADFYPSSCLGTWKSPQNAQGVPETFTDETLPLTAENSAYYDVREAEIFCGNFLSENTAADGVIRSVGLTLVWNIEASKEEEPKEEEQTERVVSENEEVENSEEAVLGESTTTLDVSTSSSSGILKFFASLFAPRASAEEEFPSEPVVEESLPSETEVVVEDAPPLEEQPTQDENASSTENIEIIPIVEEESVVSTSTEDVVIEEAEAAIEEDGDTSTSTEDVVTEEDSVTSTSTKATSDEGDIVVEEDQGNGDVLGVSSELDENVPNEHFLVVEYALDGTTWFEVGRVNPDTLPLFTVLLSITTWDDLQNIQVRVRPIETILPSIPNVLLDGMLIEVHYDTPQIVINLTSSSTSQSPVSSGGGPVIIYSTSTDEVKNAGDKRATDDTKKTTIFPVPLTLPSSLSARVYSKKINLDLNATFSCKSEPFRIDVSEAQFMSSTIIIETGDDNLRSYEIEVGSLPNGIDIKFSVNDGYAHYLEPDENSLTFEITNQEGSQKGDFSIPIIYTQRGVQNSSVICQINLVNL